MLAWVWVYLNLSVCCLVSLLHSQVVLVEDFVNRSVERGRVTCTRRAALSITNMWNIKTTTQNTLKQKTQKTHWEEQAKWDFTFSCKRNFGGCWSLWCLFIIICVSLGLEACLCITKKVLWRFYVRSCHIKPELRKQFRNTKN